MTTTMTAAIRLALAALLATALLSGMHLLTRERIAAQERARTLQQLAAVLPPDRYDNDPLAEQLAWSDPRLGPGTQTIRLGRLAGQPSALALTATAPDGYAGTIELLIGIDHDGQILGVRVQRHQETPGLGDPIEERRSPWIHGFAGRSLHNPAAPGWTVRRDGGDFDQFTGATITPRAVVLAVRRALEFHAAERDRLYTTNTP